MTPLLTTVVPLNSHIATCPVLESRASASVRPSPLKSPNASKFHDVEGRFPTTGCEMIVRPFISHMPTVVLPVRRQRMSCRPSPLKSPNPSMRQAELETVANTELSVTVRPVKSHMASWFAEFLNTSSDLRSASKSARTRVGVEGGGGAGLTVTVADALFAAPQLFDTRTQ